MAPRKKTVRSRLITTNDTPQDLLSFDDEDMDVERSGENEEIRKEEDPVHSNEQESSSVDNGEGGTRLRSSVWSHATKISPAKSQCNKCKKFIKTPNGGTSTLKKHLIDIHGLIHLKSLQSSRTKKEKNELSRERKIRLDYLANLAIYEDGRTFTDLRKSGIRKFLAEAVPGNVFYILLMSNNHICTHYESALKNF